MANSTTKNFFEEQRLKSKVKSTIVANFFETYFSIINNTKYSNKGIYYIDLFCGPGKYSDGTASTPILILDKIAKFKNGDAIKKLKLVFNDEDRTCIEILEQNLEQHPIYSRMFTKPEVFNKKASKVDLTSYINSGSPIFSFIDPFGYKDISFSQVFSLVEPIGSDCILFSM